MAGEKDPILRTLEPFMARATLSVVECQDDRASDGVTNGVEIPGATTGIVDAVKTLTGRTEDDAWEFVIHRGIPLDAHGAGPDHCGYQELVESNPHAVYASESIPTHERIARVRQNGGNIAIYTGEHNPMYALINQRKGFSFDPDAAVKAGLGVFAYDYWAAQAYAKQLDINEHTFAEHLLKVYKATTHALSGINKFVIMK